MFNSRRANRVVEYWNEYKSSRRRFARCSHPPPQIARLLAKPSPNEPLQTVVENLWRNDRLEARVTDTLDRCRGQTFRRGASRSKHRSGSPEDHDRGDGDARPSPSAGAPLARYRNRAASRDRHDRRAGDLDIVHALGASRVLPVGSSAAGALFKGSLLTAGSQ